MQRAIPASATALSIGELSKRTGCNIETIRYYEKIGLLPPPARSGGGHRVFRLDHLRRLNFVRRARVLGFTLDAVRALLALADGRQRSCAQVRSLTERHLAEIRAKIADLKAMERVLRDTVKLCADGTRPDCPIIEALSTEWADGASRAAPKPVL
jgi:MerR family transcriptional regulator, mercuric resistance operon regulatory protein